MSTFEHTLNLPESITYNGVSVDLSAASAESLQRAVSYLLSYGFGKSLQDAVAGLKKELVVGGTSEADVTSALRADMQARADAILAGTIGLRGPRLSGPDAIRRQVITAFFGVWAKAQAVKGKNLPSIKSRFNISTSAATTEQKAAVAAAIDKIRDRWAEMNEDKITEEVARRMEQQTIEVENDFDLDDLMAGEDDDAGAPTAL